MKDSFAFNLIQNHLHKQFGDPNLSLWVWFFCVVGILNWVKCIMVCGLSMDIDWL